MRDRVAVGLQKVDKQRGSAFSFLNVKVGQKTINQIAVSSKKLEQMKGVKFL